MLISERLQRCVPDPLTCEFYQLEKLSTDPSQESIKVTRAHGKTNEKKRGTTATAQSFSDDVPAATEQPTIKKAKIETHCGAGVKEPKTPSPKKRALPRKKTTGNAIKTEVDDDNDNGAISHDEGTTSPNPKKRSPTKKAAKGDADKSISPTKDGDSTVRNTPRQRAAPSKAMAAPRGIPTSWETADDADRMLVMMKEKGDDWAAIREAWKDATGQETANRYAPYHVRYARYLELNTVQHAPQPLRAH